MVSLRHSWDFSCPEPSLGVELLSPHFLGLSLREDATLLPEKKQYPVP